MIDYLSAHCLVIVCICIKLIPCDGPDHQGLLMRVWSCFLSPPHSEWIIKPSQWPAQSQTDPQILCVLSTAWVLQVLQRCGEIFPKVCEHVSLTNCYLGKCGGQGSEAAAWHQVLSRTFKPAVHICLYQMEPESVERRDTKTCIHFNLLTIFPYIIACLTGPFLQFWGETIRHESSSGCKSICPDWGERNGCITGSCPSPPSPLLHGSI